LVCSRTARIPLAAGRAQMAWKVLRFGAVLAAVSSALVAIRTYLPTSACSTAMDALLEKLEPHLDRASKAMEPVRAQLSERYTEVVQPQMEKFSEALQTLSNNLLETSQPLREKASEALQTLSNKLVETLQPLREKISEVLSQHPEACKFAAIAAASIIVLACVVRCALRRSRAIAVKDQDQDQVQQDGVGKVASPLRQRQEEPAPTLTLTQTAELLASKSQVAGAPMRKRRTSSPGPTVEMMSAEASSELLQALNTRSAQELQEIDGCGPVSAEKIVQYRQKKGALASTADLEVVGIPKHIAARIVNNFSKAPA